MSEQFKVYLPLIVNDQGVSTTVPAKLEDGQRFCEVYVGPEFFLDHSQVVQDGSPCITIRKTEPIVIHLADYEHTHMNQLCRLIHLNPSYCELFYCRVGDHPYVPSAKGLKLWKIQRHLYRYINDTIYKDMAGSTTTNTDSTSVNNDSNMNVLSLVDLIAEGSLYETDELSPGDDDELAHYMKDLDFSFAALDARGRLQEIASQVRHNSISFELRLRDSNGQVFHILD